MRWPVVDSAGFSALALFCQVAPIKRDCRAADITTAPRHAEGVVNNNTFTTGLRRL
jgi:hypothetical protein